MSTTPLPTTIQALQLAFDFASVGMCVAEGRVVTVCNRAFGVIFGYYEI